MIGNRQGNRLLSLEVKDVLMPEVLLEYGANPNLKANGDDAKSMGTEDYIALMIACRSSTFDTVQVLLDHRADPKRPSSCCLPVH